MARSMPNHVKMAFVLSHQTYAQQGFNQLFALNISTQLPTKQ